MKRILPALAPLAYLPVVVAASPASATQTGPQGCPTSTYYTTTARTAGWNSTAATSQQYGGPIDFTVTETDTTTQTFGATAGLTVGASAIVAKAEATFGINYSYQTGHSQSETYHIVIPAGRTGISAVLHREDRVTTNQYRDNADCSTTLTATGYSYIPIGTENRLDFCTRRDLTPFNYTTWASQCVGD